MTPDATREAVDRFCRHFENLSPETLPHLNRFYTEDATFQDPFNAVRGISAIQQVFEHMYASLEQPRFIVENRLVDGAQAFVTWRFEFQFRRFSKEVEQTVRGGSHLRLADDGRVWMHRDYWDAAGELYARLPLVGALMRWLKRQAAGR